MIPSSAGIPFFPMFPFPLAFALRVVKTLSSGQDRFSPCEFTHFTGEKR